MRWTGAVHRTAPAVVLLAAVAVYVSSLGNGFAFDDVPIIQQNERVHHLFAWRDIWLKPYWPFFGKEFGLYRPFIIFLYAVQWAIGGGAAWVFHVVSVALHAVATVLAFLLLDRLCGRVPALVGALLFAVHPVHTEAVANIVGQAEIVAAIGVFGAALVHVSRPAGVHVSWPRRCALVGLFAIALASKESAVVLPALLVALDFAQRRVRLSLRGWTDYVDAMLLPLFLLAATLALYLIIRFEVMSGALIGVNAAPALPFLREEYRVLNALRAFPEYVRLLVVPSDLAVDYAPGVILAVDTATPMTVLGAIVLLGLTLLALATPWAPGVGLPAAWFLITIVPVSNLFFPIGVLIAERTLYAPSLAVSLGLAYAWRYGSLHASLGVRRLAPALVAAALVLMAARTWVRNPEWASTDTVAGAFSRDHPESYRVQWLQASLAWERGKLEEAEFRFRLAHRLFARDPQLLLEYGSFLLARGRTQQAVAMLEEAYELRSFAQGTVMQLANAYIRTARWHDALARIREGEAFGAHPTETMPLRAHAYAGLGQHDLAAGAWRVAHANAARNAWILASFLARALAIAGYPDQALTTALEARGGTTEPVAQQTLDRLTAAIRAGCYDAVRAAPSNPLAFPQCDPLGDYFSFGTRLQATSVSARSSPATPPNAGAADAEPPPDSTPRTRLTTTRDSIA
jgi:protein O-mannosyl-transferase